SDPAGGTGSNLALLPLASARDLLGLDPSQMPPPVVVEKLVIAAVIGVLSTRIAAHSAACGNLAETRLRPGDRKPSAAGLFSDPTSFLVRPAGLVRSRHPPNRAQVLEFPFAPHPDIVLFVAGREPPRAIPLAEGERPQEIPDAGRAIAVDLDSRIHHIVLREADSIAKAFEQLPDRGMALMRADAIAFPDAVVREQLGDLIRVVIIVAHGAIARLELLDSFGVFENGDALLEIGGCHSRSSSD